MKMDDPRRFGARARSEGPSRRKLMAAVVAGLIVALAYGVFYWWMHLCGNCGGTPLALPPFAG